MAKKKAEAAPPPDPKPFFKRQLPVAVLLAAAALLYVAAGVLSGQLNLADDYGYIVQYGHYDRPLSLAGLEQMFSGISKQEMLHDYYRPIYTLIRSVDYRLWGTSPTGFHVTSLLFYLLAVGSAYAILRKLIPSTSAAFFAALLFAFHPIHVEAVAWIMAGGYAIAGALALLSFALYLSKRTWTSTLAFAAAALTNPPAVVVPALLCGHMWLLPASDPGEQRRRRTNCGAMAAVAAVVVYLNFVAFPQRYARAFFDSAVAARSWLANFFAYVRLMVFPLGLRTPYEGYVENPVDPRFLAGAVGILLVGAGVLFLRKRRPLAAFGLFWFLAGVLPTVTVWKNATGMADRYVFIASFGFVLVAIAMLSPQPGRGLFPGRYGTKAAAALGVLFLVFFAAVTWRRVRLWHDTESLFTDTLHKDPGNIFAARTLGRYYSVTTSSPQKAAPFLESIVRRTQAQLAKLDNVSLLSFELYNLSELCNELGIVYRELGQFDKAIALFERAIAGIPNTGREAYRTADYYFEMGLAYDKMADARQRSADAAAFASAEEKALWCYQQSFERLPILSRAYQNAGLALVRLNRAPEARSLLEKARTLTPNNVEVIGLLAKVYRETGEQAKADALYNEAIQKTERRQDKGALLSELQRSKSQTAEPLARPAAQSVESGDQFIALFRQQKYQDALQMALALQKKDESPDPSLLNNIGLCNYKLARYAEAERAYLDAIKLRPDYDTAMSNLSLVYAKQGRWDFAIAYAEKALKLQPGDVGIARRLEAYRRQLPATDGAGRTGPRPRPGQSVVTAHDVDPQDRRETISY
jgi:tetratricopeptide (TPR) repeat protein